VAEMLAVDLCNMVSDDTCRSDMTVLWAMMTLPVSEVRLAHGRQGNRRYGVDFLVSSVEYRIVCHLAW